MEEHYQVRIAAEMAYGCQAGVKTLLSTGYYRRNLVPVVSLDNTLNLVYELG